jgi:flavin reductase (DIM6/NTAB) family NADH-FMN oxidoreductase RutF
MSRLSREWIDQGDATVFYISVRHFRVDESADEFGNLVIDIKKQVL